MRAIQMSAPRTRAISVGEIVYLRASSIASITGKEGPLRGRLDDARRFHQNFDHQRVAGSGPLARLVLTGRNQTRCWQDGQSWIERGRIRSASARASRVVAQ